MKSKLFSAAILAGSMMLSMWTAQAQTSVLRVNVPFTFEAGGRTHAPGDYQIQVSKGSNQVFVLRQDLTTDGTFMPPALAAPYNGSFETARLVFRRHGEQYFLRQAYTASGGLEWLPSKAEKKLTSPFEVALVYAK